MLWYILKEMQEVNIRALIIFIVLCINLVKFYVLLKIHCHSDLHVLCFTTDVINVRNAKLLIWEIMYHWTEKGAACMRLCSPSVPKQGC